MAIICPQVGAGGCTPSPRNDNDASAITALPAGNERPQGAKVFDGKMHQVFGVQSISKVNAGKLDVVHTTSIEDGKYVNDTDYTKMPL